MSARFSVGDRVRVKRENALGNPRTPMYVRGKLGVVAAVQGTMENPLDHRGVYPPLYTVMFDIREVFGKSTNDTLWVDVHEEWLDIG